MHVVILYNRVTLSDSAGDLDVLRQCVAVEEALHGLGHITSRVACTMDLAAARNQLLAEKPDIVFNLVESLGGTDRLMPAAALLLESLQIPFTGASSLAMISTSEKLVAKRRMLDHELSTPAWLTAADHRWQGVEAAGWTPEQAIIKAIAEHASLGLNDDSVLAVTTLSLADLTKRIVLRSQELGTPHFAEQYIDGREFNLSLLADNGDAFVLPPAEIEFVDFPGGKPKIVGHDAKWNDQTSEYINTPRRFDFPHADLALLDELQALARRCWTAFDLRGYARVDFRVDADGQPWILEINANPCLSTDAGFAAAVENAGLTFRDIVARILQDATRD
jgi:D-alanine-D-alanine ligase